MKILISLSLICTFFICCSKDEKTNKEQSNLISFVSLTASKDTIFTGETTEITAEVEGENISFLWSATAGDILGSGKTVHYVAPTCTPGNNEITCTAKASNKSESKKIVITVF